MFINFSTDKLIIKNVLNLREFALSLLGTYRDNAIYLTILWSITENQLNVSRISNLLTIKMHPEDDLRQSHQNPKIIKPY